MFDIDVLAMVRDFLPTLFTAVMFDHDALVILFLIIIIVDIIKIIMKDSN